MSDHEIVAVGLTSMVVACLLIGFLLGYTLGTQSKPTQPKPTRP